MADTDANAADDRLRLLIERIERLEEEKKGIAEDIRDVYAEAKAVGYDPKIMRQVRLRKMNRTIAASRKWCSTPTRRRSAWCDRPCVMLVAQSRRTEWPDPGVMRAASS